MPTPDQIIEQLSQFALDPTRLPTAIVAILIVLFGGMIRGGLGGNATPFFWHIMDVLFGRLGSRMDKPGRLKGDLIFRGFLLTVFGLAIAFLIGRATTYLIAIYPFWSLIEIVSLCVILTGGTIFAGLGRLYRALNEKQVTKGAYYTIARTTRSDMSRADDYGITRIGMGMNLRFFDKGMVAPIIWFLIAGLPAAFLYAGLAALSWRFGRDGHNSGFGSSAMALEKLMGFVPNLLSGLFISCAALVTPTAGFTRSLMALLPFKKSAKYEEGGAPITAASHALAVTLGGATNDLDGFALKNDWVGPEKATAQLDAKHLHRVLYLCFIAHIFFIASLAGAMVFAGNGFGF